MWFAQSREPGHPWHACEKGEEDPPPDPLLLEGACDGLGLFVGCRGMLVA